MGNNRRDFLKQAGLAGAGMMMGGSAAGRQTPFKQSREQTFNMHGYAAPPLETVRVGLVGIGARGSGTVERLAVIEGVEIKALCDLYADRVSDAIDSIREFSDHDPDAYSGSEDAWKQLCEREDIDLVYTATPWELHAPIAVYAMEQGKHVFTELPVATTIEDCWKVVETSERTRRHCYMEGGDCHDGIAAVLLNMARQGFFGELVHGEGHYIHDRVSDTEGRWVRDEDNHNWFGYRPWRLKENVNRNGNLYPGHGLGPLAQMMDLNYGDQMDYMVSISSRDFTMADKMEELSEMDDYYEAYEGLEFRGNMNTSIIRTKRGRTIMLQHDISTPRPGRRFHLISGDQGIFEARPPRIATGHEGWLPEEEFESLVEEYTPPITRMFEQKVRAAGGRRGERSYERVTASDWRLIDCLRNGLPLNKDVYDAALWSCITPLSEWSVAREGNTVKVPDFTGGSWKTNERGMDLSVAEGGTTNLI
ncbi:Tat (twin-arginine translocation) pathway signal sequence [Fodinibius roseus]|uniref:Tat (Twin-arginine translocation) pathway signal sequence n=1 Tax=Fodinibius roseus TaxID=1194090 RepID=A0A1M5IYB0_9BACT|nr:Gfo/Idh/MocA family oxidoreductase [Fodinibius roseus]SHG33294.1 Tat (twin-arginine translocation) pathway signal sequence [Fodinibius roseus]